MTFLICRVFRNYFIFSFSHLNLHTLIFFLNLFSFSRAKLKYLCICLSEVIFMEGFMRKIYNFINGLEVLHLIGTYEKTDQEEEEIYVRDFSNPFSYNRPTYISKFYKNVVIFLFLHATIFFLNVGLFFLFPSTPLRFFILNYFFFFSFYLLGSYQCA